jgi:pimeloyl-ACP methyl ester carboxylesterase
VGKIARAFAHADGAVQAILPTLRSVGNAASPAISLTTASPRRDPCGNQRKKRRASRRREEAMSHVSARLIGAALLAALTFLAPARAEPPKLPVPAVDQSAVAQRGYFYVGGKYVGDPGKEIMQGQVYVEVLAPKDVRRPYPLVLIHGAAQTATNWMGTPDGRKGWAEYFVEQGYVVYMIDQPMRGRSAYHPGDGKTRMFTAANEEFQFTAIETAGTWPQAKKHTQWPGDGPNKGRKGDAIFDAFYATQVETVLDVEATQQRNRDAAAALLDKIGPAIVLTHSQSGPYGWLIADARPQLVKAVIGIEPAGPPFEATIIGTGRTRPWGPTDIPLAYDPPVKDPSEIAIEQQAEADGPDLFRCWMQKGTPRQLVNLKSIPVMIMAAEASYHQVYDHCTAKYLAQAGVKTEYIRLQDKGIRGNGHMVMIEKNNLDIAHVVDEWVVKNVK